MRPTCVPAEDGRASNSWDRCNGIARVPGAGAWRALRVQRPLASWHPDIVVTRNRLSDHVRPPLRVLLVGINPSLRSAAIGHHFAGPSNRFWKLLYESGLIPEPIGTEDDGRLPEWGLGITNLIARPTRGIGALRRREFAEGERVLRRKIRRWRPAAVALVGITLYRAIFERPAEAVVTPGLQAERLEGAAVYVLPNPSGRNANFSYAEMLAAFGSLPR
ncbi:MAG: mismatch-specific DNA-glycosylase [Acidobacteria bacterium]|nr:mismatch-specific DNA-glycosylase [Acidobacteriota bacterium]